MGKNKTSIGVKGITFDKLNKLKTKMKKKYGMSSLPNTKLFALMLTELENSENKIKKLKATIESSNEGLKSDLAEINSKLSNLSLGKSIKRKLTPPPKSITNIKIDYTKVVFSNNVIKDFGTELNKLLDGNGQLTPSTISQITNVNKDSTLESLEEYQERMTKQMALSKKRIFDQNIKTLDKSYVLANYNKFANEEDY